MPFAYANHPHIRKHGPAGYLDYTAYKPWLRDDFHFRCVYCLERERWYPNGHAAFGVDHVKAKGNPAYATLVCDYENLVYVCNRCNSSKRDEILLDPCAVALTDHIRVADDGAIEGLTPQGFDLVHILGLDKPGPRNVRQRCLRILLLYQKDPADPDVRALYLDYFGYPNDLPNLNALRPDGNSRPEGTNESYWRQRSDGRLPEVYF